MSEPTPTERDIELARNIVSDVGHSTYEQADGCVERAAKAIAQARAEERQAILEEGDRILRMQKKDGDLALELPRLLDWIVARGREGA